MHLKISSIFHEICKGNIRCMNTSNKIHISKNIASEGLRLITHFFSLQKVIFIGYCYGHLLARK